MVTGREILDRALCQELQIDALDVGPAQAAGPGDQGDEVVAPESARTPASRSRRAG